MLFYVINSVFAFLFFNFPFIPSFFSLFAFCWYKHQKRLRKVIKYAKNIHKVP